jgi:glycosyltransferase involved in cell wall biosynthesis
LSQVPLLSVIVPVYNRPEMLARCLESLSRQSLAPNRFEVIVVDDGSTRPIGVPPALSPGSIPVRLVRQANTGPAGARNTGLAEAAGDFVAFIDDDCEADPRWLEILATTLDANPGAAVGGTVVNALDRNPFAEASQLLVSAVCEYYNRESQPTRFFTTNNLAFPREALLAAGGFAEEYVRAAAEDRELCNRWHAQRRPMVTAAEAVVRHRHDLTFGEFVRQHYNYGVGARQFRAAIAARNGDRVRVEPPAFYIGLLKAPLRRHGLRGLAHSGLIALAQLANAIGFLRTPPLTGPAMTSRRATE